MRLFIKNKKRILEIEMQENSSLGDLVALLMSEHDMNNVKVLFKGSKLK